jgi:hypothetical protein
MSLCDQLERIFCYIAAPPPGSGVYAPVSTVPSPGFELAVWPPQPLAMPRPSPSAEKPKRD